MAADLTTGGHGPLRAATFPTPIGPFTVIASGLGVVATEPSDLEEAIDGFIARSGVAPVRGTRELSAVGRELDRYFAGSLRRFRTPVDLRSTGGFSRTVLETVMRVPYGELWTYGDVAARAAHPGAARAAGSALRRSPIEIFVPCHRIVPAGPGLGRYGGADERRAWLLRHEGAI